MAVAAAARCRVVLLPSVGLGRVAAEMIAAAAGDSLTTLICWSRCWPCCSPSLFAMVAVWASGETRMIDLDQMMRCCCVWLDKG